MRGGGRPSGGGRTGSVNPISTSDDPVEEFAVDHKPSGGSGASSKHGAPAAEGSIWTQPKKWPFASLAMWLLNVGLVVASVYALSNWTAINWMTGSYGWAALLEIGALLLLLYLFLVGTCLMGWSGRVEASFVHLADSPQVLYLFALALPFLCVSFFGSLALLALGNLHATSLFVATHAEAVYKAAAVYKEKPTDEGLGVLPFMKYICSLPAFRPDCNWWTVTGAPPVYTFTFVAGVDETNPSGPLYQRGGPYGFYIDLSNMFTAMANKQTERLTVVDIYLGVQRALAPYREKFGWSVLAIALICALQFGYYWYKWLTQKQAKREANKDEMPFIDP